MFKKKLGHGLLEQRAINIFFKIWSYILHAWYTCFYLFFGRNTGAFKSVEEKVGGAYANVKVYKFDPFTCL